MKDDLENTIPIKVLSDIDTPEVLDENAMTREFKYKEALALDPEAKEIAEAQEQAEEALAEKNIMEAEQLLAEENKENNEKTLEEQPKKQNIFKRLIEKFKSLPKKKKIIVIVVGVIILAAIITTIVLLVLHFNKKEIVEEEKDDTPPVIVDNFYYKDGSLHFLNDKGDEIGEYECEYKEQDLCFVGINNYKDTFNTDIILDESDQEKVQRLPIYNENYVFIRDNESKSDDSLILYSIKDEEKIEEYNNAKSYDDNYVIVSNDQDKYGLIKIDESIKDVIPLTYNYLGKLDGQNNLVAEKSNGYVIISEANKELSSPISSNNEIKYYSDNLIVAKSSNNYKVYDYKANEIGAANYATVKDKYMALVNDNKLYIKDVDKNKYNEEGISLKNNEYVRKYIYDEDNKLKNTKVSFTLDTNNDSIEIAVYDEQFDNATYTKLNKYIVDVNNKYQYMSYYDGKLYFYKDEAKEDLLGSYSCDNKNNVTSSDSTLETCAPAKDTIYEDNDMTSSAQKQRKTTAPLINSKYVFINDGNSTINLVDLTSNKTVGTYTSINTYLPDNDYKFTTFSGNVNFIAVNKKGKYGMVNLSGSNATSVYPFNYNKMEKLGEYVIAQNTDNKWLLLFSKDSSTTPVDGKIQGISSDNKRLIVSSGDSYLVYNTSGSKVSSETYKKVRLYNSYYGGVTQKNELYVYDYNGVKITQEAVKVSSTSCSIGDLFNITQSGSTYNVSLCENDKYNSYTPSTSTNVVDTIPKEIAPVPSEENTEPVEEGE